MLLTLKADNTTCSFWLCNLFYVLSMIYINIYMNKSTFIYTYAITDHMTIVVYLCVLLAQCFIG